MRAGSVIIQLDPPMPLASPKRKRCAHMLLEDHHEQALISAVFLDEGDACWAMRNREVRIVENQTIGRRSNVLAAMAA